METKERARANTPGLSRRNLLRAAPAAALVGAIPAVAMEPEVTPIVALYREIQHLRAEIDKMPLSITDEEADLAYAPCDAMEKQLMALPCQTAADFAAKAAVATYYGGFCLDWESDPFWVEARALIGGVA